MNYMGIFYNNEGRPSAFSVINKDLKQVKKNYTVLDIGIFSSTADFSEIDEKMVSIYNSREFITKKRVFSQDGKPPKNRHSPPKMIAGFMDQGKNPFTHIRKKEIPVECLYIEDDKKQASSPGKELTLGSDYFIQLEDIYQSAIKILKQDRLSIESKSPLASKISQMKDRFDSKTGLEPVFTGEDKHLFLAVFIPLWFTENIRRIVRY